MIFQDTSMKEQMYKVTKDLIIPKLNRQRKRIKKNFETFEITKKPILFYDPKSKNLEQIIERNQKEKETQELFNTSFLNTNTNHTINERFPEIKINIIKNKVVTILSSNKEESVNELLDKIVTIIKKKRRLSQWRHYSINSEKMYQEDLNSFNRIELKKRKLYKNELVDDSKQILSRSQEQMINKSKSLGLLGNQKEFLKRSIPTKYIRYKKIKKNKDEKYEIQNNRLDIPKHNKFAENKMVKIKNEHISFLGIEKAKADKNSLEICKNNIFDIVAKNEMKKNNDLRVAKTEVIYYNEHISLFGIEKAKTNKYSFEICKNNIFDIVAKNEMKKINDLRVTKTEVIYYNEHITLFGIEKAKTDKYSFEICKNNIFDIVAKNEMKKINDLRVTKTELIYNNQDIDEYIISRKYKKLLSNSLPELFNFNNNKIIPSNDSNFDTILQKYQPANEITTYGFEVIDTLASTSTTDEMEMINDSNEEESNAIQINDSVFTNKLKRKSQEDIYTSTKDKIMKSLLGLKVKKNITQSIRNYVFPILLEKLKFNKFANTIKNVDNISNEKLLKKGLMIWNIQRIKGKIEEEKKKSSRIEKFEIYFLREKKGTFEIEPLFEIHFRNSIREKAQKYTISQNEIYFLREKRGTFEIEPLFEIHFKNSIREKAQKFTISQNDISIYNVFRKFKLLFTQSQFQIDYDKTYISRWSSFIFPSIESKICLLSEKHKPILFKETQINQYFLCSTTKHFPVEIQNVINHAFMSHVSKFVNFKSVLIPEHLLSIHYPALKNILSHLIITSESFYMNPLLSNEVYEGERDNQNISSDGININIVKTKVVKISSVAEKESVSELLDIIINIMKKKRRFTQWKKSRKQIQIVVC